MTGAMAIQSRGDVRRGFTIIELLVVIAIIGILTAILTPAILGARAAARRTQCMSRERQVGQALLQRTVTLGGYFPGYANTVQTSSKGRRPYIRVGWASMILPELGRSDVFKNVVTNSGRAFYGYGDESVYLPFFVCPSDTPAKPDYQALNYIVNCGVDEPSENEQSRDYVPDSRANGVFHNLALPNDRFPLAIAAMRTSVDYLSSHDGVQSTLMLTENVDATLWPSHYEINSGVVWSDAAGSRVNGLNEYTGKGPFIPWSDRFNTNSFRFARPSSYHSGGINAVFCDGHGQFVREDIEYRVYVQLMTPNGKKAMIDVTNKVPAPEEFRQRLVESDYQ